MARRRRSWGGGNYDAGDGLKPHRVQPGGKSCRYIYSFSIWENDNHTIEDPKTGREIYVSINKRLRRLNSRKCRKMNGYNNKINGR